MLRKLQELKQLCMDNKYDFLLCFVSIVAVVVLRLYMEPSIPVIPMVNFVILLIMVFKLAQIVKLLACMIPAIKHLEELIKKSPDTAVR